MIEEKQHIRISKFLSLVLRHAPDEIGLKLDSTGWTDIEHLITKMNDNGQPIDLEILKRVVKTNNKKRFAFNEDKTKIRANQGHSIKVEHGFTPINPPDVLYHGTGEKNEANILKSGLDKGKRHHVHLSQNVEIALVVGKRHGKPIVFEVNSNEMYSDGFGFYKSKNDVWLTDKVPSKYLKKKENNG